MKKLISLITAAVLMFSFAAAGAEISEADINSLISEMDIMIGYPDGEFYPEEPVTRAQFAKIAVNASKYKNTVAHGMATSPFADVTYSHWAAPYIKAASAAKLVLGYPDSTFLPENTVTLAEAVTVAVKLLGYTDSDFSTSWPYGQMGVANNIGLTDNINAGMNDPLTRAEVRTLIYNTLRTDIKDSNTEYISSLGYSIVEDVILIATNNENSSVSAGKIYTSAGTYEMGSKFDPSDVGHRGDIVVKDGKIVLFFDSGQNSDFYAVYSATDSDVIVYSDSGLSSLDLDKNVKTYFNLQEQTLGTIMPSLDMGYEIKVFYNTYGTVDYAFVSSGKIMGPVTVYSASALDSLGFDLSSTYILDGKKVTKSDISQYDIIYYSTAMNTVWGYSKKVTGVFEKAFPNKDNVTSVTVSGTTYQLESAAAMSALSSGGKFELDDTVTLLLGKDGNVADVLDPSGVNEVLYGILKEVGTKQFTDANGNETTSYYATVALPTGNVATYMTKCEYDDLVDKPVQIMVNGNVAALSNLISHVVVEDVTLIATNRENSFVEPGKVHTSSGTYEIGNGFDCSDIGYNGDIVLKDNKIEMFFGSGQTKNSYTVYSATNSDVIVYSGDSLTELDLSKSSKAYFNLQEQSLGTILQSLDMGYGIDVFYNASGAVDYVFVSEGKIMGPVTVYSASALDSLGFDLSSTYMRDGKKVTKSDISQYDIIYYSTAMNTVWSYSKKVTGVFEKASPNKDHVTSITVSGTTYQLEGATAMSALSSGGKFELGDTVTLLLGKDGNVADVLDPSGINEVVYGVLKTVGTKPFTDINGNETTSYYVTVVLTNGNEITYMTKSEYDEYINKPVRLSVNSGVATVSKITSTDSVYGKVDASKMKLGTSSLASDIEILDVSTTQSHLPLNYTTVFPVRLDGTNILASDVLYYSKNLAGEIDKLILNDVTGDAYSYGIVKNATTTARGGIYEVVIGSSNLTVNSASTKFPVESGRPAKFKMNGSSVYGISNLTLIPYTVTSVTPTYIETTGGKYLLSDKIVCYDEDYMVVPINNIIENDDYTVTAYYDSAPASVGRVRVLKVKSK